MNTIQQLENDVEIKEKTIKIEYVDIKIEPLDTSYQDQQMAIVKTELDIASSSSSTQPVNEITIKEEVEISPTVFLPQCYSPEGPRANSHTDSQPSTSQDAARVILENEHELCRDNIQATTKRKINTSIDTDLRKKMDTLENLKKEIAEKKFINMKNELEYSIERLKKLHDIEVAHAAVLFNLRAKNAKILMEIKKKKLENLQQQ